MTVEQIKAFRLPPVHDDSLLFLWRVASMQQEALDVARAWGFVPKTELVWTKKTITGKRHFGMGRITRAEHETCLICKRGRPLILSKSVRSVFEAPVGEHSAKPDAFYAIVEQLIGGPYTELFARRRRPGWQCLGNEVDGRLENPGSQARGGPASRLLRPGEAIELPPGDEAMLFE